VHCCTGKRAFGATTDSSSWQEPLLAHCVAQGPTPLPLVRAGEVTDEQLGMMLHATEPGVAGDVSERHKNN
jgi:hypothetical protein